MLYTLYLAEKDEGRRVLYSPDIFFDAGYLGVNYGYKLVPLSCPLPLGVVHFLQRQVAGQISSVSEGSKLLGYIRGLFGTKDMDVDSLRRYCVGVLRPMGFGQEAQSMGNPITRSTTGVNWLHPHLEQVMASSEVLRQRVGGRVLLSGEIGRNMDEGGVRVDYPLHLGMQLLYLEGVTEIVPGVGYSSPGKMQCFRCGSPNPPIQTECARCNMRCYYCEDCILMGTARFCEPVYKTKEPERSARKIEVSPLLGFGPLTKAQVSAGEKLADFVSSQAGQICLVMAVCGAGKTEVCFAGISKALARGKRILFAAPRRDVIAELYPRFCSAFPGVSITAAYGGSSNKYEEAEITLATTHQAMRFEGKFDLTILDEADAYPFRGSTILPVLLQRAQKEGGKLIYVTATPDPDLYRQARAEGVVINIPARYHGRPLPIPKIRQSSVLASDTELEPDLLAWLQEKIKSSKVMIFVPTVADTEKIAHLLKVIMGNCCADFVHSRDKNRDRKREDFRGGKYPILVTTTILERGITVPDCHVLVLWADNEKVFDESTLIQIAGRAGRTPDYPRGDVLLVAEKETRAMKGAVKRIFWLNKMAAEEGLLDEMGD